MTSYPGGSPLGVLLEIHGTQRVHSAQLSWFAQRLDRLESLALGTASGSSPSTPSSMETGTAQVRRWAAWGSLGLVAVRFIPYLILGSALIKTLLWPWLQSWLRLLGAL